MRETALSTARCELGPEWAQVGPSAGARGRLTIPALEPAVAQYVAHRTAGLPGVGGEIEVLVRRQVRFGGDVAVVFHGCFSVVVVLEGVVHGGKSPSATFWAKKPLLRLGLRLRFLRTRRQGENLRMVQAHLSRDAALFPVLDALDAAAEHAGHFRRAAQLFDEVFVRGHLLFADWFRWSH